MERLCYLMTLTPGSEADYERRHREMWPEMRQAIIDAGCTNYTLFRRGLTVIGYMECVPDRETVAHASAQADVMRRWSEYFADLIEVNTDDEGNLLVTDEVWHLE